MQILCGQRTMEKITLLALILTLIKSVAGVCEQVIVSFPPEGYTGTVKIKVRSSPFC